MRSIRVIQGLIVALASTMLLLLTFSVVQADAKNRNSACDEGMPGRGNGRPRWLLRVHVLDPRSDRGGLTDPL